MMKLDPKLEEFRIRVGPFGSNPGKPWGAFRVPGPCGRDLAVMAINSSDPITCSWEHVSVSLKTRTPNWQEMTFIKRLFWEPADCVVEFHPPDADYVNMHPFTLHMWRWTGGKFPMPPKICV
jgi:hypothetical protein